MNAWSEEHHHHRRVKDVIIIMITRCDTAANIMQAEGTVWSYHTHLRFSPTSEEELAHVRTLLTNLQGHSRFTTLAERGVLVRAVVVVLVVVAVAGGVIEITVGSSPTAESIVVVGVARRSIVVVGVVRRSNRTNRFVSPCEELTSITGRCWDSSSIRNDNNY
jgi:hypothetical protein